MSSRLVSVIITTYKPTDRLAQAIDSVLLQTYSNIELIVVDDNNPDTEYRRFTRGIIKRYSNKLQYIEHEKNKNGAAARNTGIKASHGDYIAFLDDDDVYYSQRIEKCVNALEERPDCIAVYSSVDLFQEDKKVGIREAFAEGCIWKELLLNEGLLGTGSNLFIRREALEFTYGFDERFLRYQDVEFMLRVCEKGKIVAIHEPLVRKNREATNLPPYKKYHENKMLIFSKFAFLIDKLDDTEKKEFYNIHYETLFNSAIESCNRRFIREARRNLEKVIGRLPVKYYVKACIPHIYRQYEKKVSNS